MYMNYSKLMSLNPTVVATLTNSIGQEIKLVEHPILGDSAEIIAVCDSLQLAENSGFYDTEDILADHKEYEPLFVGGKLIMGWELNR